MANPESIIVLYGGVGSEREVSLVSGESIGKALAVNFEVEMLRLDAEALRIRSIHSAQLCFLHCTVRLVKMGACRGCCKLQASNAVAATRSRASCAWPRI